MTSFIPAAEYLARMRAAEEELRQRLAPFDCIDCGINTSPLDTGVGNGEYYMVQHHLWDACVPEGSGMLCVADFELRLGRRLQPSDFLDCPLNRLDDSFAKSERLVDRLTGAAS